MVAKKWSQRGKGKIIDPYTITHARPPTHSNKFASLTDNREMGIAGSVSGKYALPRGKSWQRFMNSKIFNKNILNY